MMEITLNVPRKPKKKKKISKRKSAYKAKRKSTYKAKRRSAHKRCIPKGVLRKARSLKWVKRRMLEKPKRLKQVCIPTGALSKAKSLKKLKSRYAGVKYGFARRKKAAKGRMVQGLLPFGPPPRKAPSRKKTPTGVRYEYMDIIGLSPLEREMRGITEKHIRIADKRGHAMVKPPRGKSAAPASSGYWPKGEIAANNPYRRKYRFNYTVPVYAFNDTLSAEGLTNGITAGYRPSVIKQVIPVVAGLAANSILSGTLSRMVAKRLNLSDTVRGPAGLAIGLLSAGALSMATKMITPRYTQAVFLGGMAQVLWDGYQTYLQPLIKKYTNLGCCGNGEEPDLTFGLWCPECADGLNDFLSPSQIETARPVISQAVSSVMPAMDVAMQSPPQPSAPLTATVNGKEVVVEKVDDQPPGTSGFGDFLTPNQVAQASPLGDFGSL